MLLSPLVAYVLLDVSICGSTLLKLLFYGVSFVVSGAVQCLAFNPAQRILYSCSCDQSIVAWDLRSSNLSTVELRGHE